MRPEFVSLFPEHLTLGLRGKLVTGPSVGEKVGHVGRGGTSGELIEHVAEIRPRVESVPRRTGADAQ